MPEDEIIEEEEVDVTNTEDDIPAEETGVPDVDQGTESGDDAVDDDDDVLAGVSGTDDLIGKLKTTTREARAQRAALEALGYTWDAEGNMTAPAAPQAAVETPAPTAAAVIPETPGAEAPTEFRSFPIRADRLDLFEEALEDRNSADAQDLIHGTVDANGETVNEGIGEAGYNDLVRRYDQAKSAYAETVDEQNAQIIARQAPVMTQAVTDTHAKIAEWLPSVGAEGAQAIVGAFAPRAEALIADLHKDLTEELVQQGVPRARARAHISAQLLSQPGLYESAIAQSGMEHFAELSQMISAQTLEQAVKTLSAELSIPAANIRAALAIAPPKTAAVPAAPVKPAAAPRPPLPPTTTRGSGSVPQRETTIVPTESEIEFARDLGKDPVEFARSYRALSLSN